MIEEILNSQTKFFKTNETKSISFRIEILKKLKQVLQQNEKLLSEAIYLDFNKSEFETYLTEFGFLYIEIDEAVKKLKKWSSKKRVASSLINFPSKNYIVPEPLGVTLVISAWNYPYQLALAPAIASLAAGNTVVIKPSEVAIHSSNALKKIISENFNTTILAVIEGGVEETTQLIHSKFDKIFFTGSTQVGKIVYQAAAENLIPVTLELGGKSPAILTEDCHLKRSIQRLVWGKFLNAGQTCVAPDYVLVHQSLKTEFLKGIEEEIKLRKYSVENQNFTKIVSVKHTQRLVNLLENQEVIFGGNYHIENRDFEPTLVLNPTWESTIMQEEIFGPILPILFYDNFNDAIQQIKTKEKPLAAYLFTENSKYKAQFLNEFSFGGGCINEVIMHLVNGNFGFGGVGSSGIGAYHGYEGFKTFSHFKSIMEKPTFFEIPLRYSAYSSRKLTWVKRFVNWSKYF